MGYIYKRKVRIGYFAVILFTAFIFLFSCSKTNKPQNVSEQKEKNFPEPKTILNTHPSITNLDTCPTPRTIIVPTTTASSYTIKTKKGLKTIPLLPPVTKPAGFFAQMKNYTTEQGLALSSIAASFMDKSGNLWFGTYGGGVSRYNGNSFTTFTTAQGLSNNLVLCISEDKNGTILFGTQGGGLSFYDGTSFKNYSTKQGLAHNVVHNITEDKEGNLWISTKEGISCFNGKTFENYTTKKGLADDYVSYCTLDKKGNLWFCTAAGASCYDGKIFTNYTIDQGLADNSLSCSIEDKNGNIWFGTRRGNISRFDGRSFTNYSPGSGRIEAIVEDKKGNIWFGTNEKGAICYDGKNFTTYTTSEGLVNNVIKSIIEDKSGNLWFGTYGGGISRFDGKSFTSFTGSQGLGNDLVWAIGEDKKKNVWFGTYGAGAARYDGKSFTNFTTAQGICEDVIYAVGEDKSGNIWFGSATGGVSCYDGKSFTTYTTDHGLASNSVWFITSDKKGNVWFATQAGASCFNGKSFTNYTTAQGLGNDVVYSIIEDKKGNIWFGTDGGGASCYNGKSFTNYTTAQGLPSDLVYSIIEDAFGNFWFATYGDGISRYDGKSFLNYTKSNGLADDNVTQILADKDGTIWAGTNYGFSSLNFKSPGSLETTSNIMGVNSLSNEMLKKYSPVFETYNQKTGYPVRDVNVGQYCMFLDSKGIIWSATGDNKTALVRFDPSALNHSLEPPVIQIHSLKINEENISWHGLLQDSAIQKVKDSTLISSDIVEEVNTFGRKLTETERDTMRKKFAELEFNSVTRFYPLPDNLILPYHHNNVTFEFAAIEPARSFLVNYQYILEGYDKNWSRLTNKTTATFGNIYEGDYIFKVRAQSPEGIWSEPMIYTFKVLPPWYRTWWMYTTYGMTAFGLLFGFYNWRTAALRKDKDILEQTIMQRTTEVIQQKEEAEEQKHIVEAKQREILDSIHYAKKIQEALLGAEEYVSKHLPTHFILFKPKDIISGDFYWTLEKQDHLYIAAADCTGHGVPGAMMSMLGIAFLNEITSSEQLMMPAEILNKLRNKLVKELRTSGQTKDGMDISLCKINLKTSEVSWAGANNPLWIIQEKNGKNLMIEIKADKQTIGYNEVYKPYTNHTFTEKNCTYYLFTDGYADQFGGPKGKKLMYKPLKERLMVLAGSSMEIQKETLLHTFNEWKGNLAQVDDVCLIGIRL